MDGQLILTTILRDITERKKTEEKLKESKFTLLPSRREDKKNGVKYPEIIDEAVAFDRSRQTQGYAENIAEQYGAESQFQGVGQVIGDLFGHS